MLWIWPLELPQEEAVLRKCLCRHLACPSWYGFIMDDTEGSKVGGFEYGEFCLCECPSGQHLRRPSYMLILEGSRVLCLTDLDDVEM